LASTWGDAGKGDVPGLESGGGQQLVLQAVQERLQVDLVPRDRPGGLVGLLQDPAQVLVEHLGDGDGLAGRCTPSFGGSGNAKVSG
jgi:hypothetical protein